MEVIMAHFEITSEKNGKGDRRLILTRTDITPKKSKQLSVGYSFLLETVIKFNGDIVNYRTFHSEAQTSDYFKGKPSPFYLEGASDWIHKKRCALKTALVSEKNPKKSFGSEEEISILLNALLENVPGQGFRLRLDNSLYKISLPKIILEKRDSMEYEDPVDYFANMVNADRICGLNIEFDEDLFPSIYFKGNDLDNKKDLDYNSLIKHLISDKSDNDILQCIIIDSKIASGKTTLLQRIRSSVELDKISFLPIYVDLNEIKKSSLSTYLINKYTDKNINHVDDAIELENILKEITNKFPIVLLIDRWECLSSSREDELIADLVSLMKKFPSLKSIIATRFLTKALSKKMYGNIVTEVAKLRDLPGDLFYIDENGNRFNGTITPLVATIYRKLEDNDKKYNNKYQLYDAYSKHLMDSLSNQSTVYQYLIPYLAFLSRNNKISIDCDCLSKLKHSAMKQYTYIFDEFNLPDSDTMRETLVRHNILHSNSDNTFSFEHEDFHEFLASKFLEIILVENGNIDSFLEELINKVLVSPIQDIYNKELNYAEFCFKSISNFYSKREKKFNTTRILLLKLGLCSGYYLGYSVFNQLDKLVDEYFDKNNLDYDSINLSILSAINDYYYETLTTEFPDTIDGRAKKASLVNKTVNVLKKCKNIIEEIDDSFVDCSFIYGSMEYIIKDIKIADNKSIRQALIGILYGNLGAAYVEKATKVARNEYIDINLEKAKECHLEGKKIKTSISEKFPLQRNYISLATDNYYLATKGTLILEDKKIELLTDAINLYTDASNSLPKNDSSIDTFVIPLNKAGCNYQLFQLTENIIKNKELRNKYFMEILSLVTNGIYNMKVFYEEIRDPHYFYRNINALYSDLKTKYIPMIDKNINLRNNNLELIKKFRTAVQEFSNIYNVLHPTKNNELNI